MNIVQLKSKLETIGLATAGIESFDHGWVHELNVETVSVYPLLFMTPPVQIPNIKSDDWTSTYQIKFYLLQNNNVDGNSMTPAQRDTAWAGLQGLEKLFRDQLEADSELDLLSRPGRVIFNEGAISNSDPIWISFEYEIRAKTPCP